GSHVGWWPALVAPARRGWNAADAGGGRAARHLAPAADRGRRAVRRAGGHRACRLGPLLRRGRPGGGLSAPGITEGARGAVPGVGALRGGGARRGVLARGLRA